MSEKIDIYTQTNFITICCEIRKLLINEDIKATCHCRHLKNIKRDSKRMREILLRSIKCLF